MSVNLFLDKIFPTKPLCGSYAAPAPAPHLLVFDPPPPRPENYSDPLPARTRGLRVPQPAIINPPFAYLKEAKFQVCSSYQFLNQFG